jgi:hypothetical protein
MPKTNTVVESGTDNCIILRAYNKIHAGEHGCSTCGNENIQICFRFALSFTNLTGINLA